jgi:hypothetical protein
MVRLGVEKRRENCGKNEIKLEEKKKKELPETKIASTTNTLQSSNADIAESADNRLAASATFACVCSLVANLFIRAWKTRNMKQLTG